MIDWHSLRRVVGAAAATATVVQTGAAIAGIPRGRRDYADVAWGPGLAAIGLSSALLGTGDARRRWALAGGIGLWGARLGSLILGRVRDSDSEDPRYTEFLADDSTPRVIAKVFLTQGVAQCAVTLPVQLAAASAIDPRSARRVLLPVGLAVMAIGAGVEALADRQKSAFMARDRAERPAILDTGLWGWSRHPNYFGDSLFWDGTWLVAAASRGGEHTWPAPALMSWFLIVATGARRTERRMQDRPGFRDYQQRVSFFVPLPPRSTRP